MTEKDIPSDWKEHTAPNNQKYYVDKEQNIYDHQTHKRVNTDQQISFLTEISKKDSDLDVNKGPHRRMTTEDELSLAIDESLQSTGIDISELSDNQRQILQHFLKITDAQPDEAIAFLTQAEWSSAEALDLFYHSHPDHAQSLMDDDLDQISQVVINEDPKDRKRNSIEDPNSVNVEDEEEQDVEDDDISENNDNTTTNNTKNNTDDDYDFVDRNELNDDNNDNNNNNSDNNNDSNNLLDNDEYNIIDEEVEIEPKQQNIIVNNNNNSDNNNDINNNNSNNNNDDEEYDDDEPERNDDTVELEEIEQQENNDINDINDNDNNKQNENSPEEVEEVEEVEEENKDETIENNENNNNNNNSEDNNMEAGPQERKILMTNEELTSVSKHLKGFLHSRANTEETTELVKNISVLELKEKEETEVEEEIKDKIENNNSNNSDNSNNSNDSSKNLTGKRNSLELEVEDNHSSEYDEVNTNSDNNEYDPKDTHLVPEITDDEDDETNEKPFPGKNNYPLFGQKDDENEINIIGKNVNNKKIDARYEKEKDPYYNNDYEDDILFETNPKVGGKIPDHWVEKKDKNGKIYWIDTYTQEMYTENRNAMHQRVNTTDKIKIVSAWSAEENPDYVDPDKAPLPKDIEDINNEDDDSKVVVLDMDNGINNNNNIKSNNIKNNNKSSKNSKKSKKSNKKKTKKQKKNKNNNYEFTQHRRFNTNEQIEIAKETSLIQQEFDQKLSILRTEVNELKEENGNLIRQLDASNKRENELRRLQSNQQQHTRELRKDWDRMNETMQKILDEANDIKSKNEVDFIHIDQLTKIILDSRENSNFTPLPTEDYELKYDGLHDMFPEKTNDDHINSLAVPVKDNRGKRLSYGAVNEMFRQKDDDKSNIMDYLIDSQYEPSYENIALLFDENSPQSKSLQESLVNNDNTLPKTSKLDLPNNTSTKLSFAGVDELFRRSNQINPNSYLNSNNRILEDKEESPEDNNNKRRNSKELDSDSHIIIDRQGRVSTAGEKARLILEANSDPSKAQQRLSVVSTGSQPDPVEHLERRTHSRGPSFALSHMFRNSDDSDSDDSQSVASAPESDYFAISAFYGIDGDEDLLWNNKRESYLVGDYGTVQGFAKKRVSSRLANKEQSDNVKQLFLDTYSNYSNKKKVKEMDKIVETKNENNSTSKLSNGVDENNSKDTHKKKETYSGLRNLFGNDTDSQSSTSSDNEQDDNNTSNDKDNKTLQTNSSNSSKSRPSTAKPLGATFDGIKTRKFNNDKNDKSIIERNQNSEDGEEKEPQKSLLDIEKEQKEKENKLRKQIEKELRQNIEEELRKSMYEELKKSLTQQITQEISDEYKQEYNNKLQNEIENNKSKITNSLESKFNNNINELKNKLEEVKNLHKKEIERLRIDKIELIKSTSKQIDSLRNKIFESSKQWQSFLSRNKTSKR